MRNDDILLLGPVGCSLGAGRRHIWSSARPGRQWNAEAVDVFDRLSHEGLLASLFSHERSSFREFVDNIILEKEGTCDVWGTELRDPRVQNLELVSLFREEQMHVQLPSSSLGGLFCPPI